MTGRREAELDALVAKIEVDGGRAAAIVGDVKDETLAERLVDAAVTRFGGLDIAFNNAGVTGEVAPVAHLTVQQWHDTLDINLTGAFLGAEYQAPAMIQRGGGSIIFTSPSWGTPSASPVRPPTQPARPASSA